MGPKYNGERRFRLVAGTFNGDKEQDTGASRENTIWNATTRDLYDERAGYGWGFGKRDEKAHWRPLDGKI